MTSVSRPARYRSWGTVRAAGPPWQSAGRAPAIRSPADIGGADQLADEEHHRLVIEAFARALPDRSIQEINYLLVEDRIDNPRTDLAPEPISSDVATQNVVCQVIFHGSGIQFDAPIETATVPEVRDTAGR